jgi:hypothetical protein
MATYLPKEINPGSDIRNWKEDYIRKIFQKYYKPHLRNKNGFWVPEPRDALPLRQVDCLKTVPFYFSKLHDGMYNSSEGVGGTFATIQHAGIVKLYTSIIRHVFLNTFDVIMDIGAGQNEVIWCLVQMLRCKGIGLEICPHRVNVAAASAVQLLLNQYDRPSVKIYNVALVLADVASPSHWQNVKLFYLFDTA